VAALRGTKLRYDLASVVLLWREWRIFQWERNGEWRISDTMMPPLWAQCPPCLAICLQAISASACPAPAMSPA